MGRILFGLIVLLFACGTAAFAYNAYQQEQINGLVFLYILLAIAVFTIAFLALAMGVVKRFSFQDFELDSAVGTEAKTGVEESKRTKISTLLAELEDSDSHRQLHFIPLRNRAWIDQHTDDIKMEYNKLSQKDDPVLFVLRVELNSRDPHQHFSTAAELWDAISTFDDLFDGNIYYQICFVYSKPGRLRNQFFALADYFVFAPHGRQSDKWENEASQLAPRTEGCEINYLKEFMEKNFKVRQFNFSRIDRNQTTLQALIEMIADEKFQIMVTRVGRPLALITMPDILNEIFHKEVGRRKVQKASNERNLRDPNPFTVSYTILSAKCRAAHDAHSTHQS